MLIGTEPLLLTVSHDGDLRIPGAEVRKHFGRRDLGTLQLALRCYDTLCNVDIRPTVIWQTLHRCHADVNRGPEHEEPYAEEFKNAYDDFHSKVDLQVERMLRRHGRAVHLDIHGAMLPAGIDCVLGTNNHATSPRGQDKVFAGALSRRYAVRFSPDELHNFEGRFTGGWVVRRSAAVWGAAGLDAIQIEVGRHLRQPEHTVELATHLAEALALLK